MQFKLAGHSAVLHGCTVEDEAFVGMGATLLDGVVVEKHAMVAAGALVRQNTRIPCGEVCYSSNAPTIGIKGVINCPSMRNKSGPARKT